MSQATTFSQAQDRSACKHELDFRTRDSPEAWPHPNVRLWISGNKSGISVPSHQIENHRAVAAAASFRPQAHCYRKMWPQTLEDFLLSRKLQGVNLDTTAFVAACSELTHDLQNAEACLSDAEKHKRIMQFDDERGNRGVLFHLFESLFQDHGPLVHISDIVRGELETIVRSFAGPKEAERARILFDRTRGSKEFFREHHVPEVMQNLFQSRSKHMRSRHQQVFTDGVKLRLLTLTADKAFLSACRHRGHDLVKDGWVVEHSSRSLAGL
ncbi:hypothetical protein TGPRC2_320525 [Toxoplasma gondii TgCatPRC2]|uniref:DUF1308 domain-containing protein n=4 Tax=Toxoplasma gondii TaxID=5811 RepID=S7UJZ6_TOXGG|nr:hypothetical protein TGME49_320525 [Toxoplasma gondii ME49]EPR58087.1 hypothetical protein TGGT1_320525 [Toxoplasma gondii GT1]EPT31590.1 hypothetical protein TGME49_320525 [Toxoplasma gondii ME49]KAF4644855.1 hypothetical protein TGRH88_006690 [Toxoplasma gondii]KYK66767.1 hypothetical protein TGPRC2_320525 [Toxoplasma gondii TgCatPRC2]|eukprot:XP_018638070.1 hypothetical protein TGME49_320525 [Toxoplasma gondii ME49]